MTNFNEKKIVNTVRRLGSADKTKIAEYTGISYPTVLNTIKSLSPYLNTEDIITIKNDIAYYIGFSIGFSHIKLVVLDFAFNFCKHECIQKLYKGFYNQFRKYNPPQASIEYYANENGFCVGMPGEMTDFINIINTIMKELLELDSENNFHIRGVGFAFSGIINEEENQIVACCNVGFLSNVTESSLLHPTILQILQDRDITISFIQNAKSAALAEKEKSENCINGEKNTACIYMGTGIGIGFIINNQLYNQYGAGQIGHTKLMFPLSLSEDSPSTKLVKEYDECKCGHYGCIEQLIRSHVFGKPHIEDFKAFDVTEADNDQILLLSKYTSLLISNLINSFTLDTIVITGKFANVYDRMWPYLTADLKESCFDGLEASCKIRTSRLGMFAPAVGAAIRSYFSHYACDIIW